MDTPTGEDWFMHFQDVGAYGRLVHLQPMKWVDDWPVIGIDKDGDGCGEPVLTYKKPNVGKNYKRFRPMAMMMGPVTMGGKKRMTFFAPKTLNRPARMTYTRPAQATPKQA